MVLRARLPPRELDAETKDTVRNAVGLVGTKTAILLGLLVTSAKNTFDVQRNGVAQLASNVIILDRSLAHYGDETGEIRQMLRASVRDIIQRTWPEEKLATEHDGASVGTEGQYEPVFDRILGLTPKTEAQRTLQAQALKFIIDTGQLRWSLFSQRESSIPLPLLIVIVFWLAISFASFGLFAPRNATAIVTLIACALAVASAMFLILELDRPFRGMIHVSSVPLHKALEQLGR